MISVIGDIAMAVEGNFDRYLPNTMPMLIQAASTTMDEDADDEMLEFLDELREAVLDAYAVSFDFDFDFDVGGEGGGGRRERGSVGRSREHRTD